MRGLALIALLAACAAPSESQDAGPRCALSADELRANRGRLIPGWIERAESVVDLPDGLRLRFANRAGLVAELTELVELERACCSFLRFRITIEPGGGPVEFEVTGPAGTREMLRAL